MKKITALIICLLLVGSVIWGAFAISVQDTADKVVFTETVLYGDPKAADGLCIDLTRGNELYNIYYRIGRFLWNTKAQFKEGEFIAATEQKYSFKQPVIEIDEEIYIRNGLFGSLSAGQRDRRIRYEVIAGIEEEYAEKLDREAATVTKPAKEIFSSYPIDFSIRERGRQRQSGYYQMQYDQESLNVALDEYFRFEVPEDVSVDLFMQKGGILNGVNISSGSRTGYSARVEQGCLSYKNSLYFFFELLKDEDGSEKRADYSLVPGGYGVYRMDLTYEDGVLHIEPSSLCTVASFGEETDIKVIKGSSTADLIYVFAKEKDEYVVYSVDKDTGEKLQRLSLGACKEKDFFAQAEDGYILFGIKATEGFAETGAVIYVLKEDEKGLLSIDLKADLELLGDEKVYKKVLAAAEWYPKYYMGRNPLSIVNIYEDGKLYILSEDIYGEHPAFQPEGSACCGIAVAVYDKTGLLFFGNYKSSLGGTYCTSSTLYPDRMWLER